ncbi:hypothetical protein NC653_010198 [Populus alba x Populus x berolinensis]|uniref:RRM domain-containing protein n=1 Tax=Populus alba x Populus x berolinensis TaxID=444605 RepID=A0AAD6W4X0_9ROSI|nr:hypothetical protein NC653_010198 [Populus alba x Populus x berolinensis]
MLSLSPSPSPLSLTNPNPTKAHFPAKSTPPPLFCLDEPTITPIDTLTPSPTLKGPFWEQHTQTSNPLTQYKKAPPSSTETFPLLQTRDPSHQSLVLPTQGFLHKNIDHPIAQTFYFECFPSWLTFTELRKEFQRYGIITELFVSKRLNKSGKRFGFLSLSDPEADITEKLNKIWFSSYKLRVNIAKYQRQVVKQRTTHVPTFSSIKVPIKQRDGRSYKEVVNEKPVRNVTYQTSEEDREWLRRSLVGLISNGTDYAKIKNKMLMTLHNMEGFRFLGASKAILTFKTQQDMQLVADEEKEF